MLFLTNDEINEWNALGEKVLAGDFTADGFDKAEIGERRAAMFRFYAGCLLAAKGRESEAKGWFAAGALEESEDMMTNAFTAAFLERQNDQFVMPATVFEDPAPYIHFGTTPAIKSSREKLLRHSADSLPVFKGPFSYLDIGCGDGSLTAALLTYWRDHGVFTDVKKITLLDASAGMLAKARETIEPLFGEGVVDTINGRIENITADVTGHYDVALSSLAYHHIPWDLKVDRLQTLKDHFDHFIIFELDANNDFPELFSPELAASVYQSYGRIIDFVFQHDAPIQTAEMCVDCFLMTELVSLMTELRGKRNDYHMLRRQWHELFQTVFNGDLVPMAETTPFGDEHMDLYMIHYGR